MENKYQLAAKKKWDKFRGIKVGNKIV